MSKLLFILKRREDFNSKVHNKLGLSTGLYNSAKFMSDMMIGSGVESVLEVAIDNNCIEKFSLYRAKIDIYDIGNFKGCAFQIAFKNKKVLVLKVFFFFD